MRIAKDGKLFDIDTAGEAGNGYVEVIQFLRPNGQRRRMLAYLGADYVEKAKDMILSAEVLSTGVVAVYARFIDAQEHEEFVELAKNKPGPTTPSAMLQKLIDRKIAERGGA